MKYTVTVGQLTKTVEASCPFKAAESVCGHNRVNKNIRPLGNGWATRLNGSARLMITITREGLE